MFKKALFIGAIFALHSTATLAAPYIGVSAGASGYKSKPGIITTVFVGHGTTIQANQAIYLGGELNASVARYSFYNNTYGLGISFIPGLYISPQTMVYGRFGLNSIYTPHKLDATNYGTQVGLGLQTNIAQHWDVRGEYVYSNIRNTGQYNMGLAYKFD